jgi:hypothetical protein
LDPQAHAQWREPGRVLREQEHLRRGRRSVDRYLVAAAISLDLGASYALNSRMSLFFRTKNLTSTRLKFTEGTSNARPIQREFYDQSYSLGFRVKL